MKHLVLALAVFLPMFLLGNQALTQELEGLFSIQKTIKCGPASVILIAIKKYEEKPKIIFENNVKKIQTLVFFNDETGSGTVVEVMPNNKIWCIISYGINGWSENFGQKS